MKITFSALIENSIRISSYWHRRHKQIDGDFDYFIHNTGVAMILARASFDEELIATGYVHDLLQFTDCPTSEISDICGERVLYLIEYLTEEQKLDPAKFWEKRKELLIDKIRKAPWEVKAVCVADRIHSLQTLYASLQIHGMSFFDQFYRGPEKKLWFEDQMCLMLKETWKHPLVDEYDQLINDFVDLLESLNKTSTSTSTVNSVNLIDYDQPILKKIKTKRVVIVKKEKIISDNNSSKKNIPVHDPVDLSIVKSSQSKQEIHPIQNKKNSIKSKVDKIKEDQDIFAKKIAESINNNIQYLTNIKSNKSFVSNKSNNSKIKLTSGSKSKKSKFVYLRDEEVSKLLPSVLQIAIMDGELSSRNLQKQLKIDFVVSFRIMKELKRLHVIKRADSIIPRKVNKALASKLLKDLF